MEGFGIGITLFSQLFAGVDHDDGDIFRIVPPEEPPGKTLEYKNKEVQKSLTKIQHTPLGIRLDPRTAGSLKKQYIFCMTSDRRLKKYSMAERTGDPDLMDLSDIMSAKEEYRGKSSNCSLGPTSARTREGWQGNRYLVRRQIHCHGSRGRVCTAAASVGDERDNFTQGP